MNPTPANESPASPTEAESTDWLLTTGVLAFVLSRTFLLFGFTPEVTDVPLYYQYAVYAVDKGYAPYAEIQIAYPPAGWWLMRLPRQLDTAEVTDGNIAELFPRYHVRFRWQMAVIDLTAFVLLLATVARRRENRLGWACWGYVATTTLFGHLVYDRLDIALLALVMAWAYCAARSIDAGPRGDVAWLAGLALLGLAVAVKLSPVVMIPLLVIARRPSGAFWPLAIGSALVAGAAMALPFLIYLPSAGDKVFLFLTHHGGRGILTESLYASILMFCSFFGLPVETAITHRSFHLVSRWSDAMRSLSTALVLGFLGGLFLWALALARRYDRMAAYRFACLALIGFVLLAHVISPQYLIWTTAVMLLLGCEVLSDRGYIVLVVALIAMAAISMLIFPQAVVPSIFATIVPTFDPTTLRLNPDLPTAAKVIMVVRNSLFLAIAATLAWRLLRISFLSLEGETRGKGER